MTRPAATAMRWAVPKRAHTRFPSGFRSLLMVNPERPLNHTTSVDNPQEVSLLDCSQALWYPSSPMGASPSADELRAPRSHAIEEIRKSYPPLMTTAQVAELMQCTIGDVRDKVHSGELSAVRWGQQFRFFREEVLAALRDVSEGEREVPGD